MKLWIDNLPPGTSNEDLRALVRKYTQIEVEDIADVDSENSSSGALISISDRHPIGSLAFQTKLELIQHRLDRMYWKEHRLAVHILPLSDPEPELATSLETDVSSVPD